MNFLSYGMCRKSCLVISQNDISLKRKLLKRYFAIKIAWNVQIIRIFSEQIKKIDVNHSQMAPQDLRWLRHPNEFSEENNIGLMIMSAGV